MNPLKLFGAIIFSSVLWSDTSFACSLELDANYTISPFVDDGLSRAERTSCALGNLSYYDQAAGWRDMVGADGKALQVSDMAGAVTPSGEFLVVILGDGRVAMRWGGPGNGLFFVDNATHRSYFANDSAGKVVTALNIDEVSYDPGAGIITVVLQTSASQYCAIASDPSFVMSWSDWSCVPTPVTAKNTTPTGSPQVPVLVGGETEYDACAAAGIVIGGPANVRAGPGMNYPVIDVIPAGATVGMCETHPTGAWEGVIYPIEQQDCGVFTPLPRQPYSGPCNSGWVDMRNLQLTAG